MQKIDPVFLTPTLVERDWGRSDVRKWCAAARALSGPVAEAWVCNPFNPVDDGRLGDRLADMSAAMLGDVGRAPPKVRLVFTNVATTLPSTSPISFWTVLEASGSTDAPRPGERIRAYEGASVNLPAGCVALEVSSAFQPKNEPREGASLIRLPPVSGRQRATLFRDASMSVERWSLPDWSYLRPDGETCHVIVALTGGIKIDDRWLDQGDAVFLPALGRPVDITAEGAARLLIAYPDQRPTSIWRHSPGPDPSFVTMPPGPQPGSVSAGAPLA